MFTFFNRTTRTIWALLAVGALLVACGGGGGISSNVGDPSTGTGNVTGNVLDANTGVAVAGATVQAGSLTTTTAADGKFAFNDLTATSRLVIKLTAASYAEQIVVTPVVANTTTVVSSQMLRVGTTATIDIPTGGTVTVPGGSGQVILPGGTVTGTGNVIVTVTPINPAQNPGLLPGDYTTGTSTQPLESFGAVIVTINNPDGTPAVVAAGATFSIRIPVSSRASVLPASLPLFYLDTTTGRWVREGTASLGGTAPGQYYDATVSHAGIWNVALPYDTINATGCVADVSGARVTGSRVVADGIDYTGSTGIDTDALGNFAIPIKKAGRAAITARSGGKTSNSVSVGPSAVDVSSGACLVLTDQANNVTMKLTWGENPLDVDPHLFSPSGDHIYFDNKGSLTAAPWANLDVDDLISFGPEITTLRRLQVGTYTYAINNFSNTYNPGLTGSPTRVELNVGGVSSTYAPPPNEGTSPWWTVFTLTVNAQCAITITPVNTWSATQPAPPVAGGAITYCTAP